jgi:hypothetical protein
MACRSPLAFPLRPISTSLFVAKCLYLNNLGEFVLQFLALRDSRQKRRQLVTK